MAPRICLSCVAEKNPPVPPPTGTVWKREGTSAGEEEEEEEEEEDEEEEDEDLSSINSTPSVSSPLEDANISVSCFCCFRSASTRSSQESTK